LNAAELKNKNLRMKLKLFAFSILCLICVNLTFSQEKAQERIKLKGVLMENDYHNNITWIKPKPVPLVSKDFSVGATNVTHMQIYFGMYMQDSVQKITPIRLVNKYKDNDWIFFDKISYLFGTRKEVRAGKGKIFKIENLETDRNVNRGISEKSDIAADDNVKNLIKYIIETGLNIRYTDSDKSQYVELNVPKGTKRLQKSFKALIDSYELMNEKFELNKPF
jgi:hypothetical protein